MILTSKERTHMAQLPTKRIWLRVVVVLFSFAVVLIFLGAFYFSSVLLRPNPFRCTVAWTHFCGTPAQQSLPFSKVSFQTSDGFLIKGWWIPAPARSSRPGQTILFSHGRGADRREGMRFAVPFHKAGFSLLAFDYRHCGKSQKSYNSMGFYERLDLRAAVTFATEKKRSKRIGVMGFSMGAAITMLVMAKDKRIHAAILEGGFANASDAIADRGRVLYGLPRYPLMPFIMGLYSMRGSLNMKELNPEEVVGSIAPRPLFFIQGSKDTIVLPSHAKRLYKAAKQPKTLWMVPGGTHTQTWQLDRKQAESRTTAFFQKHL